MRRAASKSLSAERAYTSCNEARKAVKQRRRLEAFKTPAMRYLVSRASAAEGTRVRTR
ncbi:hypothetical protein BOSEA31B_11318 [Hyphomicrobiales bacterium]|nr:hypothetical protein BOSEA31B_11318 [Hyphomicrobiales bacterium]CAH1697110.1 hypothetical protein BOSEA1005_10147 [Hyphomicrobiales bacterium]CAI0345048.1 hypothetical protein BO1005MUT1_350415 [Hyphomicrobiales bacterium]